MEQPDRLLTEAEQFAGEIAELLESTVTDATPVTAIRVGTRVVVQPIEESGQAIPVLLTIRGQRKAELRLTYRLGWDSYGEFLAVEYSQVAIAIAGLREPFIRFEYVRGARTIPSAHVQVHAESGALGYMLALKGSTEAPKVQTIHIPVGGKRFRPSLEDVPPLKRSRRSAPSSLRRWGHRPWDVLPCPRSCALPRISSPG